MEWRPLIVDPARKAQLVGLIRQISDEVTALPASSISQLGDLALLRAYLAQDGVVEDPDDVVGAGLAQMVTQFARESARPSLYSGAAGLGWVVEHLAGGETADRVCSAVDAALDRKLADWSGDYDLIVGLV